MSASCADSSAVVDATARVCGMENLHVVDASIFKWRAECESTGYDYGGCGKGGRDHFGVGNELGRGTATGGMVT
jgi:hypothetical protein